MPKLFFEKMNFEKYADFIMNFPILFIQDKKKYFSGHKYFFKDFMEGKINEIDNRIENILICVANSISRE